MELFSLLVMIIASICFFEIVLLGMKYNYTYESSRNQVIVMGILTVIIIFASHQYEYERLHRSKNPAHPTITEEQNK